jgi:hypothetical protein
LNEAAFFFVPGPGYELTTVGEGLAIEKDCRASIAKPVTAQECLVDRYGRLGALPDSHGHKEDIAGNVSRDIYSRNTAFFRFGINHHAPFVIPLTAKNF